jgi:DNA-directed RNA polymerase subunit M/transcription elongation factor TFIIS
MESLAYISGLKPADAGPLSRFMPPLEDGVVSTWLSHHAPASSWLLDPFGFSPKLVLEAARAGYRALVTANNPITRFLVEMSASPPAESDFKAALADLAVVKKGDERLESHLQSLYLTTCEKCGREVFAQYFLWRKGEEAPFARYYECKECGDAGEKPATPEDAERAKKIAATDGLHRSRAFERVVKLNDDDRFYAEEAIQHYLPRPLYALTTIINRLDSLNLSAERRRALTAMILVACDAGNTLWAHPSERLRPKQLITPNQFREHNIWIQLERGLSLWSETAAKVQCFAWPNKVPESGGICIYEGRLKDLAHQVKKEIPIAAVIGSVPRPNQAFWTLSALWAGWLWGSDAVEPYKIALRRRRYDWAWNATALNAAFIHLFDLLAPNTPFFGLLPEAEPAFLTSALTAADAAGFNLKGLALRTEHDPVQLVWERGEHLKRESAKPDIEAIRSAIKNHLTERGEPASYMHVHAAALMTLAESHVLKQTGQEFDDALRNTQSSIETALKDDSEFVHYSSGESVETGLWGLSSRTLQESLSDHVEMAVVNFLQKNPESIYLEIEDELYQKFPALLTPSKMLIYAVLNSYAEKSNANWKLRAEDVASARHAELRNISGLLELIGQRLKYKTRKENKLLIWEDNGKVIRVFYLLASALIGRALAEIKFPAEKTLLVIPGGRAGLVAYKENRDPALAEHMKSYRVVKYRLVRALSELPILTRETFEEQIANDPVEQSKGQLMMF